MILAVTGHRPQTLGSYHADVQARLVRLACAEIKAIAPDVVLTGMALGWDIAVAQACVSLRVPFKAVVPFVGQESVWPRDSQALYRTMLSQAVEKIVVCDGGYAAWKMKKRNIYLVNNCDMLLALWNGLASGGTFQCVEYADEKGVEIRNCWESWEEEQ